MKTVITLVLILTALYTSAQDITALNNYKFITIIPASANVGIPRFEKLNADIESGIRQLLNRHKIPVVNSRKDAIDKGANNCEILTCVYSLSYRQGMMFNAIINYSLHFTDCNDKQVLVLSGKSSVGAAVGAKGYVKLFSRLFKPYHTYKYDYKAATK